MTFDFIQDLREACEREGVHFLIITTGDCGETFRLNHNMDKLPRYVDYPDGCRRTKK